MHGEADNKELPNDDHEVEEVETFYNHTNPPYSNAWQPGDRVVLGRVTEPIVPLQRLRLLTGQFFHFSRWFLAPLYVVMIAALVFFIFQFGLDSWALGVKVFKLGTTSELLVLAILELIDMIMVANVVQFIIASSYLLFIDPRGFDYLGDRKPTWSDHLNSTTQKGMVGKSLIGVSSVYLLRLIMSIETVSVQTVGCAVLLHFAIFATTYGIFCMGMMHTPAQPVGKEHT